MNEVATIDLSRVGARREVAATNEPGDLLQIVAALQRGGQPIDPSAVRELYAIQREILADKRAARMELLEEQFNEALAACEAEIGRVVANKENSNTHSWYATYAAIDKEIRPIYTKNGVSLSFDEEDSPKPDHVRVICWASKGGFKRKYHRDMPSDGKGAKGGDVMTKTHAVGSAFTYGQRYIVIGIFNIAIAHAADDDDGNGAGSGDQKGFITEEQATEVRKRLKEIHADGPKSLGNFLAWIKADSIERIAAKNYKVALDRIDQKGKEMAAGTAQ